MKAKKSIRIGVDARTIFALHPRGTGKNLIDLYGHVAKLRPDWEFILFHDNEQDKIPTPTLLNVQNIERRGASIRGHRFNAWEQVILPYRAWRDRVDVLHCPANTCPIWASVPTVVTIHDLIPLDGDDRIPVKEVNYFKNCVQRACRNATIIFTPSNYTRLRLIGEFQADSQRVVVNQWAPDSKICELGVDEYSSTIEQYQISRPYCIHFGSSAARKNTERTLRAWSQLNPDARRTWRLLVIGLDRGALHHFECLAKELGIDSEVRLKGFAPENHLPALLSCAEVLVFASLSEGFGLPILDAWATDTAIITGNKTSLPEIAGDAAFLVDPINISSIAEGLNALMNNGALRKQLCELGRVRLAGFTWHDAATRYINAIEKIVTR